MSQARKIESDLSSPQILTERVELVSNRPPLVGIIVVHYQKIEDTLRCLESLRELDYENAFVIVVDSASPNGSGFELRSRFSGMGVEVIISPENLGFAASNNFGIKRAQALGAKYVWLLNADTSTEKNALSELIGKAEAQHDGGAQAGAWGSKILYGNIDGSVNASGKRRIWSAGGFLNLWEQSIKMRGNQELDAGQYDTDDFCDYLPGCSILVSCSVLDSVGYLSEDYFMYFEETDWCSRMRRRGFLMQYVPQSVVYHHFDDSKVQSPFNIYYYNRNSLIFWSRHGGLRRRFTLFASTLFFRLPRVICDYFRAENLQQKSIFRAHLFSALDFICLRFGKRHQF